MSQPKFELTCKDKTETRKVFTLKNVSSTIVSNMHLESFDLYVFNGSRDDKENIYSEGVGFPLSLGEYEEKSFEIDNERLREHHIGDRYFELIFTAEDDQLNLYQCSATKNVEDTCKGFVSGEWDASHVSLLKMSNTNKDQQIALLEAFGIKKYDGKVLVKQNGTTEIQYLKVIGANGEEIDNENDLLEDIVVACSYISDDPETVRNLDENGINRLVRNSLKESLSGRGYAVHDQSEQGLSETETTTGHPDIIIDKNRIRVAIIEGLIHSTKDNLHRHIRKAIVNYNQSGCKRIYILCYSRNAKYDDFWNSCKDWASTTEGIEIWGEVKTHYSGIKCVEGCYNNDGISGKIYIVGVNTK